MPVSQFVLVLSLACAYIGEFHSIRGSAEENIDNTRCPYETKCAFKSEGCDPQGTPAAPVKGKEWRDFDQRAMEKDDQCKLSLSCRAREDGEAICGKKRPDKRSCSIGEACYEFNCKGENAPQGLEYTKEDALSYGNHCESGKCDLKEGAPVCVAQDPTTPLPSTTAAPTGTNAGTRASILAILPISAALTGLFSAIQSLLA